MQLNLVNGLLDEIFEPDSTIIISSIVVKAVPVQFRICTVRSMSNSEYDKSGVCPIRNLSDTDNLVELLRNFVAISLKVTAHRLRTSSRRPARRRTMTL